MWQKISLAKTNLPKNKSSKKLLEQKNKSSKKINHFLWWHKQIQNKKYLEEKKIHQKKNKSLLYDDTKN